MPKTALRLSLGKKDFLNAIDENGVPPLYSEIPYRPPSAVYPVFSGPGSFILESIKGPFKIARYSFIGFSPCVTFIVKNGAVGIKSEKGYQRLQTKNPTAVLRSLLALYRQKPDPELPPFQGGAAGLLSYDFVHYLEKLPATARDDLRIPDAHFLIMDRLIAFDHLEKKAWAIFCPGVRETYLSGAVNWPEIYDEAEYAIEAISANASRFPEEPPARPAEALDIEVRHETTEEQYTNMVRRAKEYIAAGDIFQANLSLRLSARVGGLGAMDLYGVLSRINPAPFAGLLDFGGYSVISSSPERLLRLSGGFVETRPMAGTRPRGGNEAEDGLMRAELLLNEKERAEHIMLIDLERNDIGRVCDYGTVEVDELMITEDYSHVIHIVSNVKGRLNGGKDPFDAIKAVFPGGTITGVPKVRCMEIIDELEPVRRGPYTGSMGYIGFAGAVDLNIMIRSFTLKDGTAYVQAGAGIVADSDPLREYHEALKKAEALVKTLEMV